MSNSNSLVSNNVLQDWFKEPNLASCFYLFLLAREHFVIITRGVGGTSTPSFYSYHGS